MTIIMMTIMVVASSSSTGVDHGVVIATGVDPILDGVVVHGEDQEALGVITQEEDPGEEALEEEDPGEEALEAVVAALVVAVVDVEDVETESDILSSIQHSQLCAIYLKKLIISRLGFNSLKIIRTNILTIYSKLDYNIIFILFQFY